MMRRTELRRGAPMMRGGFSRPEIERKPAAPCRIDPSLWRQASSLAPAASAPIEKHHYVRNKRLREAYRLIPCQHCGREDGTVCCAHSNFSVHGKGAGIKADDSRAASLCAACHVPILDQGSKLTRDERREMFWSAHVRSVRELVSRGFWPKDVAIPDVSKSPWGESAHEKNDSTVSF